jgi:2-iminobutanoate/2-iminopropanoate deaminase
MPRNKVETPNAVQPIGPYSQVISALNWVIVSGQTPLDGGGNLVAGSITQQVDAVMKNIAQLLKYSGANLGDVQKATVYLTNMADYDEMNAAYARHFTAPYPARTTVAVVGLPKGANVEIEVTALIPQFP